MKKTVFTKAISISIFSALLVAALHAVSNDYPANVGIRPLGKKALIDPSVTVLVLSSYHPQSILAASDSKAGMTINIGTHRLQSARCAITLDGDYLSVRCGDSEVRKQRALSLEDVSGAIRVEIRDKVTRRFNGKILVEADDTELKIVNQLPLEEYLPGVVGGELETQWSEAMKAQAIVARTYALKSRGAHGKYDFCDLTHCQDYRGMDGETSRSREAVKQTAGLVLVYKNKLADVWYHSTCGGRTSPPDPVWGGCLLADAPYLKGVDDGENCSASQHYRWAASFTPAQIRQLEIEALDGALLDMTITETTRIGQVKSIELKTTAGTRVMSGYEFYRLVGNTLGWNMVKSVTFTIGKKNGRYIISGRGLGHGIGFCQWGAKGQAAGGRKFARIIKFYFPGAEVKSWDGELPARQ